VEYPKLSDLASTTESKRGIIRTCVMPADWRAPDRDEGINCLLQPGLAAAFSTGTGSIKSIREVKQSTYAKTILRKHCV